MNTMKNMNELLEQMVAVNASDLHFSVGRAPELRVNGVLQSTDQDLLTSHAIRDYAYSIISAAQIEQFEKEQELDFSYGIAGIGRFRINLYKQRGSIGIAVRHIPYKIPTIEGLGLPEVIKEFALKPAGLFLVTGPTGCGKSTTLASMINYINQTKKAHIMSIEDPIEYLHQHNTCVVNQREVGSDTHTFNDALKHVVRQDPDIILIGEMRDFETMQSALTLAETGHLVFATLHTMDTTHAISRIVDVFPPYQQQQIRIQLSMVLLGIISQQLLPNRAGDGRILIYEMMRVTNSIQNMMRENDLPQIRSVLQTGKSYGMCTMNSSLLNALKEKTISRDEALLHSLDQDEFVMLMQKQGLL